ncbi:Threonine dehydratase [Lysobacter sp. A03]|nr:Threonine dehydratase [Lysobacter sp. A03]
MRETLARLALEEHVIAEGAGALALAAGRRVAGRRKCAVVSGGNIDASVLAQLLSEVRPRAPRRPRRRSRDIAPPTHTPAVRPLSPASTASAPSRPVDEPTAAPTPEVVPA